MNFEVDLKSSRKQKADLKKTLSNKYLAYSGLFIAVLSVIAGAGLVLQNSAISPVGWILMLPAALILAIFTWYRGDLADMKPGKYLQSGQVLVHEALEPDALASLKVSRGSNLSIYDVWLSLKNTEDRFFLQNRYGIDDSFFEQMANREAGSAQIIWQNAYNLSQKYSMNTTGFSNMVILIAILESVPGIEQLLNKVELDVEHCETSISWMNYVKSKRRMAKQKQRFGGVGRDWAYGYTPILSRLGLNLSRSIEEHGFFMDTSMRSGTVQQVLQLLSSTSSTVTLVGETGVGKTTTVYALAQTLLTEPKVPEQIKYHQIVQLDAPTLMANAKNPGQLEELVLRTLNEANHAKNIILFFDEAQAFFGGNIDLANILEPVMENGAVKMIMAMRQTDWQQMARRGLAARLTPVNLSSAPEEITLAILRDQVGLIEYKNKVVFTYQALQEAYKLGARYETTQAMPGAALNVLKQAAGTSGQQLITKITVQQSVEQTYGIKLQTANSSETSDLLNLEEQLKKQVISQDKAVSVVANALRRSRSGVGNPNRPVGTFLFLGPTGVGKTELSKALARSYFGNEAAIIRVDMNQYVQAKDADRLINPGEGGELSFLGKVRAKPFSVVLLDEIEKAHPAVINSLLQLLDEGIMRDSEDRTVSFRDAIIIATSNAGADEIRRIINDGQDMAAIEDKFIDTLISRGLFAPELVNRFDEVVVFKPLDQNELLKVVDIILGDINKTLSAQKVTIKVSDEGKRWLVDKGYDSKLGARPIRRMAQRYIENIVARKLLEKTAGPGSVILLDVADFEATT